MNEIINEENIVDTLLKLRQESGLTQQKFAEMFHIPDSTYSQWESGRRKPPVYVVQLIAEIMNKNALIEKYEAEIKCNPLGLNIPLSHLLDYLENEISTYAQSINIDVDDEATKVPVKLHFGHTVVSGFSDEGPITLYSKEHVKSYSVHNAPWGQYVDIYMCEEA